MPNCQGHTYHQPKMAEGKTSREAMRSLKRQIAELLWRTMRDDFEQRLAMPSARTRANRGRVPAPNSLRATRHPPAESVRVSADPVADRPM